MVSSFNDQTFKRFHRQISVKEFGERGQKKLAGCSALIIGCGGLGTLVSTYLASSGVGTLVLNDDDIIEISNLPRQLNYREIDIGKLKVETLKSSILERSSSCRIRTIATRMDELQLSLEISLADVVVDCSDNFDTRFMLNRLCSNTDTPLVSGAVSGWNGQIVLFDYKNNGACYECLVDKGVLSETALNCESVGVISPVVGIISSLQAIEVIKLLIKPFPFDGNPNTSVTYYDGLARRFDNFEIKVNPQCEICNRQGKGVKRGNN
jgi:sulfur carrier protein ThiS adenylyltransferase